MGLHECHGMWLSLVNNLYIVLSGGASCIPERQDKESSGAGGMEVSKR